jgi:hypothetical protein
LDWDRVLRSCFADGNSKVHLWPSAGNPVHVSLDAEEHHHFSDRFVLRWSFSGALSFHFLLEKSVRISR